MNTVEMEEQARLEDCQVRIRENLQEIGVRLDAYAKDIQANKDYMWEARRDMDHIDKVALRQSIEQTMRSAEVLKSQRQKLQKLRNSPYFGRFDFARGRDGSGVAQPIYVGVHDFRDEASGKTLVYDWRAPVSSLFYDYEIGPAQYQAPSGAVEGRLELKRQFRIREGRMEFMLESGVNIVDDVLQQELSRSSDEGMKNIVATIQRDQNAIIRNAEADTLIIQGVAGSGKTSIALHRIAFLLYRFKDTLSSKDILIISPNRVFADYIGNVLPELGEEQVSEIGMETLADELLQGKYRFQTFFEQTSQLLEGKDAALRERIAAKASLDFLKQIDAYIDHLEANSFTPVEWRAGIGRIVPDWHFEETWQKHRGLPVTERIAEVVRTTEYKIFLHYKHELDTRQRRELREAVRGMVKRTSLRAAYKGLFEWMGRPELFKPAGGKLEYSDVFPLIHLKMRLEGVENLRNEVKHLLIDEMQDYSPVQYAVLGRLFPCRKTILGDATQSVNPYGGSNAEQIQRVLKAAAPVKLTKSYRSSWEIMRFALGISPNEELVPIERHGEPPQVIGYARQAEVAERILAEVEDFQASTHHSLAIIAKTQRQAEKLHRQLTEKGVETRLLDAGSSGFSTGIIVCTAHLAKGLEFDRVIVPDAGVQNYGTDMDRNLLYVACTRAMHRLTVLFAGEPSPLLPAEAMA
ncbi:HelD family protein [Nitratireductor sp. GCM10026969]|uniref:HelD family protein n=1 Tax=Nitratireductor sp. GCM10026969 TaxID=3252645 RepID=UPI00361993BF